MSTGGVSVTTKVQLEGNFFKYQPGKTLKQNVGDMLEAIAAWLDKETDSGIAAHAGQMPYWTGWTLKANQGYVESAVTGKHWETWAAAGTVTAHMDAKDARRTKAAAASIERRWHPWRNAKSGVYRSRAVVQAALAKGID